MKKLKLNRKNNKNYMNASFKEEEIKKVIDNINYMVNDFENIIDEFYKMNLEQKRDFIYNLYNENIINDIDSLQEIFELDDFMNIFFENAEPLRIANAVHFGNYNPSKPFARFDGYENIESLEDCDVEEICDEIINDNSYKIKRYLLSTLYNDNINLWDCKKIYNNLKDKKKKIDKYISFAFDENQLQEAMEKLNVQNKNELISIGYGGITKKENLQYIKNINKFNDILENNRKNNNIDYFIGLIDYELDNHEAVYNYNIDYDMSEYIDFKKLQKNKLLFELYQAIKKLNLKIAYFYEDDLIY